MGVVVLPLLLTLSGCGGGIKATGCTGACTCSTQNDCACADGQSCFSCNVGCSFACGGGRAVALLMPTFRQALDHDRLLGGSSCDGNVGANSTFNCTGSACGDVVGANSTVKCVDANCAFRAGAGSVVSCDGQASASYTAAIAPDALLRSGHGDVPVLWQLQSDMSGRTPVPCRGGNTCCSTSSLQRLVRCRARHVDGETLSLRWLCCDMRPIPAGPLDRKPSGTAG